MADRTDLVVPDLGDFADVEVIEVLVQPGDIVAVEDSLVTLETDKASMDVPAATAGTVVEVSVSVGDKLNAGDTVVVIEASSDVGGETESTAIMIPVEPVAAASPEAAHAASASAARSP